MPLRHCESQESRAVSPVIGVILMVAITVILAAVIGAFVLEIGDQQETAPNTSFDSEQRVTFYEDNSDKRNLTEIEISHAGGDTLDISNNRIKVNGNASWWGVASTELTSSGRIPAQIQPDTTRTAGTNEQVSFTSGESWEIVAGNNNHARAHDKVDTEVQYVFDLDRPSTNVYLEEESSGSEDQISDAYWTGNQMSELRTGDNVKVVWRADSGGKTQTLFQYEIQ